MERIREKIEKVSLSKGTKEYLYAYEIADEAAIIVSRQVQKCWGEEVSDEMTCDMFNSLTKFKDEILRLMTLEIDFNLSRIGRIEI